MDSERKPRVMDSLRGAVGGFGLLLRREATETNFLAIDPYASKKSRSIRSLINAETSKFVGPARTNFVLHVDHASHIAKVFKSIVSLVAVYVVHVITGMLPRHVQPRKPGGSVGAVVQHHIDVTTALMKHAHLLANSMARSSDDKSSEDPGLWVVLKKLAESVRGNHSPTVTQS